jgi:hypothetical protein
LAVRNEYTETVRDVQALIRKEADAQKRADLAANVERMQTQIERQKEQLADMRVLEERIKGIDYLVKGVLILGLIEVAVGVVVAVIVKH